MGRNETFKDDYFAFMSDIINGGFAEQAREEAPVGAVNYIPHHGVYHSKKNKLRIVFDCSANESTKEAIKLAREARELCHKGGLRLHKFVSNDKAVTESLPESERASEVKHSNLDFAEPMERTLGIMWNITADVFFFQITLKDRPTTRRGILSTVASLYDPLGLVSPVILNGKRILQEMCRRGVGWDDILPDNLKPAWEQWCRELPLLQELKIPRCHHPMNFGKPVNVQLHHFSDASMLGYGQCLYVRLVNQEGRVHCTLIFAKSRVAPIKVITVGVNCSSGIGKVQQIRERTSPDQWHYISTDQNPADYASRGLTADQIRNVRWFQGPSFLWEKNLEVKDITCDLKIGDPEVKAINLTARSIPEPLDLLQRLARISTWSMMIRVLARLRMAVKGNQGTLVQERTDAEKLLLQLTQRKAFQDELQQLTHGKQLKGTSRIHDLDPYVEEAGMLRVGGRLKGLAEGTAHPIILPKHSPVTRAIVRHFHQKVQHQGRGITQNEIRSNGYWIVNGSKVVN
ncbi:uncharacterized protein [Diadema antillarum]|uniref:uncharacterized protein n=1 Tax=Diadema antillarum TaxID=105358 RepID=UPI003A89A438